MSRFHIVARGRFNDTPFDQGTFKRILDALDAMTPRPAQWRTRGRDDSFAAHPPYAISVDFNDGGVDFSLVKEIDTRPQAN